MLILLSPSKTQDFSPLSKEVISSVPEFLSEAETIARTMKGRPSSDVQEYMHVSEKLAEKTVKQYQNFSLPMNKENTKPALFAYTGDVYKHIDVEQYSAKELAFAQQHLRIISGLYGILRPLDRIQPYRMEMKLQDKFWKPILTDHLQKNTEPIINLASKESTDAIDLKTLDSDIYNIVFKEKKGDKYRVVAIFAKYARGMMADWIIKNGYTNPEDLKLFNLDGYTFATSLSKQKEFVFIR